MRIRFLIAVAVIFALGTPVTNVYAAKKKKKEDQEPITQTLPVLKDPPASIAVDTDKLSFRVAPMTGKGLLSAQVRDALKYLLKENRGSIVKLRAFVAGTGDMRRVSTIVSEVFSEKKQAMPALTTVQAGGLPMDGAQVVIESIAVERKTVNPHGVAVLRAMPIQQVESTLTGIGLTGRRVIRATCYVASLEDHSQLRASVTAAFPDAAVQLIQMQRLPFAGPMLCETIAMLERPPAGPVEFKPGAVLISAPRIVLTGTQLAFHSQDSDVKLAFQRLGRTLEAANTSYRNVIVATIYPLAQDVSAKVHAHQGEFFSKERPPIVNSLMMEGLPSIDASFGIEVMALP